MSLLHVIPEYHGDCKALKVDMRMMARSQNKEVTMKQHWMWVTRLGTGRLVMAGHNY
jgi:hypothetical protein